jgi:hypothetical protein
VACPSLALCRDVDLDGRDDLLVFTEQGSYYLLSTGNRLGAPVSTAVWSGSFSGSVPLAAIPALGASDASERRRPGMQLRLACAVVPHCNTQACSTAWATPHRTCLACAFVIVMT